MEYFLDNDIDVWIFESLSSSFKGIIGFLGNLFLGVLYLDTYIFVYPVNLHFRDVNHDDV